MPNDAGGPAGFPSGVSPKIKLLPSEKVVVVTGAGSALDTCCIATYASGVGTLSVCQAQL